MLNEKHSLEYEYYVNKQIKPAINRVFFSLLNLYSDRWLHMLGAGFLQIRDSIGTGRSVSVGMYLHY